MTAPANVRTCYRHPDRVAGISCQRCDRPICPSCMHQASVGFHCPECTKSGRQKEYRGVAALQNRPIVTQILMALNIAVFVIGLAVAGGASAMQGLSGDLARDGGLFPPLVPAEPWRLFTSGFLHAGLIHLGFNMWVLWVIGRMLEPVLGRARFLALYLASLMAGSLGVVLLDVVGQSPLQEIGLTVGASGAIFGLMGGAVVVARDSGIDLMRSGLLTTIGLNLLITFALPGISIGGHLGGLVGGALAGLVVVEVPKRVKQNGDMIGAFAAVGVGLVYSAVSFALASAEWGALT